MSVWCMVLRAKPLQNLGWFAAIVFALLSLVACSDSISPTTPSNTSATLPRNSSWSRARCFDAPSRLLSPNSNGPSAVHEAAIWQSDLGGPLDLSSEVSEVVCTSLERADIIAIARPRDCWLRNHVSTGCLLQISDIEYLLGDSAMGRNGFMGITIENSEYGCFSSPVLLLANRPDIDTADSTITELIHLAFQSGHSGVAVLDDAEDPFAVLEIETFLGYVLIPALLVRCVVSEEGEI